MKARQRNRPVTAQDLEDIAQALWHLTNARMYLRRASSHNAAQYVHRAIKSGQGAANNAQAHFDREQRKGKP
jgi:hypothetical protein